MGFLWPFLFSFDQWCILIWLALSVLLPMGSLIGYFEYSSVLITLMAFILFAKSLSNEVPIKELAFFASSFQLLLSPFLAYYILPVDPIFKLLIPSEEYFSYAIPGVLSFWFGLSFLKNKSINQLGIVNIIRKKYDEGERQRGLQAAE